MKAFVLITALIITISSCDSNDDVATAKIKELNISKNNWNELKVKNDNSYVFTISFTLWSGHGSITEIKVVNGVIVERNYEEYVTNNINGEQEITSTYLEDQAHIGLNEKGAPAVTIDELYRTCAGEYLVVSTKTNEVYFETSDFGLMTLCGYVPKGCMDDCFNGIRIKSFEWL